MGTVASGASSCVQMRGSSWPTTSRRRFAEIFRTRTRAEWEALDPAARTRVLRDGRFDAILLDLSLPDSQGLDTVAHANVAAPRVPISSCVVKTKKISWGEPLRTRKASIMTAQPMRSSIDLAIMRFPKSLKGRSKAHTSPNMTGHSFLDEAPTSIKH